MGSVGSSTVISGQVSFSQIVKASDNTISFDKGVTMLPSGISPYYGKKGDLADLIKRSGKNDFVINMYRDRSGANDLKRMQSLGFTVQAYYKGEQQEGSNIPPRDYYYVRRK